MKTLPRLAIVFSCLTALVGCDGSTATTLTPPTHSVASVVVVDAPSQLVVGTTVRLSAIATDDDAKVLTRTITWASSNSAIATVTSDGVVAGVAPGSTIITATADDKTGSVTLSVTPAPAVPVATVVVSSPVTDVEVGTSAQLTAIVKDASGNALTGRTITWSSTNALIATVDSTGLVTALSGGTTQITATSEGKSGSKPLTVLQHTGLDITLSTTINAKRFLIAIDGGGLPQPQMFDVAAATSTTGQLVVSLAPGGPYRVRALAIDAGATGPSTVSTITVGATGKVEGAIVSNGARTPVSVNLTRPTVQVSAPPQAQYGYPVTITWTYTDAGDVLESDDRDSKKPYGFLNYSDHTFTDGATTSAAVASATKLSPGVYQFTATFTPLSTGPLYFQTKAIAFYAPFAEGSTFGGYLLSPSSARGEALGVMTIQY